VTALSVVVTVDLEGQVSDQLLRAVKGLYIVIEVQLMFEGGEEALCHRVIPTAALGRQAAADLVALQQPPVDRCPVLAALILVDQELLGFDRVREIAGPWALSVVA